MEQAVNQPDRKRLWGKAGSRCAMCNRELTEEGGVQSIVGDEAHVRSPKPGGPRHDAKYPVELLDAYVNRVLLCKVHHKLVDDNEEIFTTELLEGMKRRHEARVSRLLGAAPAGWTRGPSLEVLVNGTQAAALASEALAYVLANDHPRSREEADVIGRFLQAVQDWGDLLPDVGAEAYVHAAMDLDEQMAELSTLGYAVVGGLGRYLIARDVEVPAAMLRVVFRGAS